MVGDNEYTVLCRLFSLEAINLDPSHDLLQLTKDLQATYSLQTSLKLHSELISQHQGSMPQLNTMHRPAHNTTAQTQLQLQPNNLSAQYLHLPQNQQSGSATAKQISFLPCRMHQVSQRS